MTRAWSTDRELLALAETRAAEVEALAVLHGEHLAPGYVLALEESYRFTREILIRLPEVSPR